jgi:hypothetical protein
MSLQSYPLVSQLLIIGFIGHAKAVSKVLKLSEARA